MKYEERFILEKEIEVLNDSRELHKFDYNILMGIFVSITAVFLSLIVSLSSNNFKENAVLILFLILIWAIFSLIITLIKINITKEFKKRSDKSAERYKKLGVNIDKLKKELNS